ncbi:hypothetical protein [Lactococcus ileimucosae]|uniref:hypothetical protein n=1 Tax=Lactococcus ileimucosae TaxID=2941329 RepID=UPI00204338A5|nr:hypothetical protein [Lactococcus ileimucosae]
MYWASALAPLPPWIKYCQPSCDQVTLSPAVIWSIAPLMIGVVTLSLSARADTVAPSPILKEFP